MKKLVLNEKESLELQRDGVVVIKRKGLTIMVNNANGYPSDNYFITIINPYKKVVVYHEIDIF